MLRLTTVSFACALGFASIPIAARAESFDLFAGQTMPVGVVDICDDGDDLVVTYDLSGGAFGLLETHLYLGASAPQAPVPGRFPYQHLDLASQTDRYAVPLSALDLAAGDLAYVAAHAVVSEIKGYEAPALELDPSIPPTATLIANYPGGESYWDIEISDGGALDGAYDGWCVDTSRTMASDEPYTVMPLSSYDPAAQDYVDHPDNLDALNWLINGDFVGRASPSCEGAYTFSDVQRAIWTLVDDPTTAGLLDWSECRVAELVAAALTEGEGFEPGCLDAMVVLLVPIDPVGETIAQVIIAQVTVIDVDLACEPIFAGGDETAWASGGVRFRRSWASYATYEVGSSTCE